MSNYTEYEKRLLGIRVKATVRLSIPDYAVDPGEVGEIIDFGISGDPLVQWSGERKFICLWKEITFLEQPSQALA